MAGGTRVGKAYVSVTADGDGVNEDIVDAVDEAGPGVERAGKDHGERYGDRFSDGFFDRIRGKFGKQIGERLSSHFARTGDESGAIFAGNFTRFFKRSNAGQQAGNALGTAMMEGLRNRLEGADDLVSRLTTRLDADTGKNKGYTQQLTKELRLARDEAGRTERSLIKLMQTEGELTKARVSRNRDSGRDTGSSMGDRVGDMFGGKSRNNALHLFGKTLGSITKLITGVTSLAGTMFKTFQTGFQGAADGAKLMTRIGGGFSSLGSGLMTGIAKNGPAAIAMLAIVSAALAFMASIVSALIALVVALAATIVSALVASLLVLTATISAVVAAGGLLTAAIMSMTNAQKTLFKDAMEPLRNQMVGIGQIMMVQMTDYFPRWSANLQTALMQAVPVAQQMGDAFGRAGNILTQSFSGPGFHAFANSLAIYLPSIITRLSSAFGSFLNGLLGMFAVLMPYVNQFAGYLARVAAEFSVWANSAAGASAITTFVDRAIISIQALWGAVVAFGQLIGKVLFSPEAMDAGNTIFGSIRDKFIDMYNAIVAAQADGSLKKWFDDAINFGSQLWSVIEALYQVFVTLANSNVLGGIAKSLEVFASSMNIASAAADGLFGHLGRILDRMGLVSQAQHDIASAPPVQDIVSGTHLMAKPKAFKRPKWLEDMGNTARQDTYKSAGGYVPDPVKSSAYKQPKQYKNPYTKWANSLIKDGPSTQTAARNAMLTLNKAFAKGIRDAAKDTGGSSSVITAMEGLFDSLTTGGETAVNTARSALNSAASTLASAASKGAAKQALRKVRRAQVDMRAALADQKAINKVAKALNTQKIVRTWNVNNLLSLSTRKGEIRFNTTLAEFAAAREILAERIEEANQKLTEAIALRDDYKTQVADSIKAFGMIATATAKTIDGVEQALTAGDITSNLQERLNKIKAFQTSLQLLLAQGLSNDAYKQIVDEGVESGTVLANALLAGGVGAIAETNSLVGQINNIANTLGTETSSRMYQAGVDAAQGLVDGLTSLSARLDAAATALGESIAAAVQRALGIKSPSSVMRALMGAVGDGAVLGLGDQHAKVGSAASALAGLIAVNPGTGAAAAGGPVSGNGDQRPIELTVNTPTEDPMAVAHEAINELVGRL